MLPLILVLYRETLITAWFKGTKACLLVRMFSVALALLLQHCGQIQGADWWCLFSPRWAQPTPFTARCYRPSWASSYFGKMMQFLFMKFPSLPVSPPPSLEVPHERGGAGPSRLESG